MLALSLLLAVAAQDVRAELPPAARTGTWPAPLAELEGPPSSAGSRAGYVHAAWSEHLPAWSAGCLDEERTWSGSVGRIRVRDSHRLFVSMNAMRLEDDAWFRRALDLSPGTHGFLLAFTVDDPAEVRLYDVDASGWNLLARGRVPREALPSETASADVDCDADAGTYRAVRDVHTQVSWSWSGAGTAEWAWTHEDLHAVWTVAAHVSEAYRTLQDTPIEHWPEPVWQLRFAWLQEGAPPPEDPMELGFAFEPRLRRRHAADGTVIRQWWEGLDGEGKRMRCGPFRRWWPSGQRAEEGSYRGGLREGLWRFWKENGEVDLARTGRYRAGERLE